MRSLLPLALSSALLAACATKPPVIAEAPPAEPAPVPQAASVELDSETLYEPPVVKAPEPQYLSVWERAMDRFELESCENHASAQQWTRWYADRPEYMGRVFARAEPWIYYITQQLEDRGMPGELALLPIVESAYDPFAYSRGRAMGTWQFIASTGKRFGLKQDWWYDGRRDVYSATTAALDYLQYLNDYFDGDWLLALAAYNAGEGRVGRAVARAERAGKASDYWHISIPRETRGYVPKLLGLKCLFEDAEQYAFELPQVADEPVVRAVQVDSQVDLVLAAQLSGTPVADLFKLNPGYNRWATPPDGPHQIVLPLDNADLLEATLEASPGQLLMRWDQVTVQRGDTLGKISQKHNVPVSVLRSANNIQGDIIREGQRLRLPRDGDTSIDPLYATAATELRNLQARLVAPDQLQHRIRSGESLSTIARRYQVSVRDLQRWNNISNPHSIRAGQMLQVFHSPVAAPAGNRASRYTVQRGDSLWRIARRNKVTVNDLKQWNNLSDQSILRPGQSLKLAP